MTPAQAAGGRPRHHAGQPFWPVVGCAPEDNDLALADGVAGESGAVGAGLGRHHVDRPVEDPAALGRIAVRGPAVWVVRLGDPAGPSAFPGVNKQAFVLEEVVAAVVAVVRQGGVLGGGLLSVRCQVCEAEVGSLFGVVTVEDLAGAGGAGCGQVRLVTEFVQGLVQCRVPRWSVSWKRYASRPGSPLGVTVRSWYVPAAGTGTAPLSITVW